MSYSIDLPSIMSIVHHFILAFHFDIENVRELGFKGDRPKLHWPGIEPREVTLVSEFRAAGDSSYRISPSSVYQNQNTGNPASWNGFYRITSEFSVIVCIMRIMLPSTLNLLWIEKLFISCRTCKLLLLEIHLHQHPPLQASAIIWVFFLCES